MVSRILEEHASIVRLRSKDSRRNAEVERVITPFMGINSIVAMVTHITDTRHSDANRARKQWNQLRIDMQRCLIHLHQPVGESIEKRFSPSPLLQRLH